jgi:hypothetical protein
MPRDLHINVHHETVITDWIGQLHKITGWCERHIKGGWNIVADSGQQAARGDGKHVVIFLCDRLEDQVLFRLSWMDQIDGSLAHLAPLLVE